MQWYGRNYPGPPGRRGCYPFQLEFLRAAENVVDLAQRGHGGKVLVFCCPRQSGKNETDARLTIRLLTKWGCLRQLAGLPRGYAVKSAPTWDPQIAVSMRRLREVLDQTLLFQGQAWRKEGSRVWMLPGNLRSAIAFLSAGENANKKGLTANLWQCIDEAQNTSKRVYDEELAPMRASTGAPVLLMGTEGSEDCLMHLEIERLRQWEAENPGERAVWVIDWEEVARWNPAYGEFVQAEINRLGKDHPVICTQYRGIAVSIIGRFLTQAQVNNFFGDGEGEALHHNRLHLPMPGQLYVGGLDFCGASETVEDDDTWEADRVAKRDSTVGIVARLTWRQDALGLTPEMEIVDVLWLPGMYPDAVVHRCYQFFFEKWRVQRLTADGRGVGEGPAFSLHQRRPEQVTVLKSTSADNTRMGYRMLGLLNHKRLRMFRNDNTPEWTELHTQMSQLRRKITVNGMRWAGPEQKVVVNGDLTPVHDDGPKAIGYCIEAGYEHLAGHRGNRTPRVYVPWDEAAGYRAA